MKAIANTLLKGARPEDKIHLLLWDAPTEAELQHLAFYNNAQRVNYRENLLARINPSQRFLSLHHNIDKELEAIKSTCVGTDKHAILLEGLDCLITYLHVQENCHITLFWDELARIRKLKKVIWILLPHNLAPANWSPERMKIFPQN